MFVPVLLANSYIVGNDFLLGFMLGIWITVFGTSRHVSWSW